MYVLLLSRKGRLLLLIVDSASGARAPGGRGGACAMRRVTRRLYIDGGITCTLIGDKRFTCIHTNETVQMSGSSFSG